MTMNVSCYSFTAVAQRAEKLMTNGGSLLTLTYYGAEKVMPHYNVMGVAKAALEASVRYLAEDLGKKNIRVNAVSAGPIKTLAASGIGDFRYILKWNELNSPLRRTVTTNEVGDTAMFLLSDLARGITGEILHVDAGYHIVGMKAEDAPDIAVVEQQEQRWLEAVMSHNSFGHLFRVTTFGESHGPAIGCVVDGCPPGIPLTEADIQPWLDRRKPGQSKYVTQRKEPDQVRILSGVFQDERMTEQMTTGTPIALVIDNVDARSKDYSDIRDKFRPGHADYTYWAKYGIRDYRGGGRQSARETATRVAAGAIARKILDRMYGTVTIRAALIQMGTLTIDRSRWDWDEVLRNPFNSPDAGVVNQWADYLEGLRKAGSSCGAIVEVVAEGIPVGLGAPIYGKLDADIAVRADGHQRGQGRRDRRRHGRGRAHRRREFRRDARGQRRQAGVPQQPRGRNPRRHLHRPADRRALLRSSRRRRSSPRARRSTSRARTPRSPPRAVTIRASASAPFRSAKR